MSKKGIRLTEKELKNALVGGTILGGGGGGSGVRGVEFGICVPDDCALKIPSAMPILCSNSSTVWIRSLY